MITQGMGKGMRLLTVLGKRVALPYFFFKPQTRVELDPANMASQELRIISDVSMYLEINSRTGMGLQIKSELSEL